MTVGWNQTKPVDVNIATNELITHATGVTLINSEAILSTCESAWTTGTSGITLDTSTVNKVGTYSATFELDSSACTGIKAHVAPATADTDITSRTHLSCYAKVTSALPTGELKVGFDNTALAAGTQYYVDLPAIATKETWYKLQLPLISANLTAANLATLDSVSSLVLYMDQGTIATSATWTGVLFLDDIRIETNSFIGNEDIVIPESSTLEGKIFKIPAAWTSPAQLISSNKAAVVTEITYYNASLEAMDQSKLSVDQYLDDHPRAATYVQVEFDSEIGSNELRIGMVQ